MAFSSLVMGSTPDESSAGGAIRRSCISNSIMPLQHANLTRLHDLVLASRIVNARSQRMKLLVRIEVA
jgi:hypothetical protein